MHFHVYKNLFILHYQDFIATTYFEIVVKLNNK